MIPIQCRKLFFAILYQGLLDLFQPVHISADERQLVRDWFLENPKRECSFVCDMAGISYESIRERVLRRLRGEQ